MPRITHALSLVLSLAAVPALAQVSFEGSVRPVNPFGTFPLPSGPPFSDPVTGLVGVPGFDEDADAVLDFITTQGNGRAGLDLQGISQTDPTGQSGDGLAFNAAEVFRGFEADQNILVGDLDQSGQLNITNGAELRYQYLVLGGISEDVNGAGGFGVEVTIGTIDSDFILSQYLTATSGDGAFGGRGGDGTLIVSGAGSLFNNDPNLIPADLQTALNLGAGATTADAIFEPVTDLSAAGVVRDPVPGNIPGFMGPTFRDGGVGAADSAFDVIVGLSGNGRLEVLNGGRVEIQDALQVAVSELSTGAVVVDGAGSFLVASGRDELDEQSNVTAITGTGDGTTSFIGAAGTGSLLITNSGGAEFRNGLSIGRGVGGGTAPLDDLNTGSGIVTVSGAGSTLRVNASAVAGFTFDDTLNAEPNAGVALAVGEFVSGGGLGVPIAPGNADLQSGRLEIEDGATVTTGFSAAFPAGANDADDANVVIGANGEVALADGSLVVGNKVFHDGVISGFGLLNARSLETSVEATIRGGNPNAEQPTLAEPLRIVLNDDFDTDNPPAFLNRGTVEGLIDLSTPGQVANEGRIEVTGEIAANSLTTTVASEIIGTGGSGDPLRIRISGSEAIGTGTTLTLADETSGDIAFQNNGLLAGELDVVVAGAFLNGTNQSTAAGAGVGLSNGGVIRATGSIQAGVFLNHRLGVIEIGQGETLSILALGEDGSMGVTYPGLILEDGEDSRLVTPVFDGTPEDANFRAANLGTINVIGGTLDTGVIVDNRAAIADGAIDHFRLFRNARVFDTDAGETIGTITSNNAQINFREGVFNTGVIAFTGGTNTVNGSVFNGGALSDVNGTPDPTDDQLGINFGTDSDGNPVLRSGVITVSGPGTTVTFTDSVVNNGILSVGSFDNVVNFLGDLTLGIGEVQLTIDGSVDVSAILQVAGTVDINGATLSLISAGPSAAFAAGFSVDLLDATAITADSAFSAFDLPTLEDGLFWDIILDQASGDISAVVVQPLIAPSGADFTGDGVVDVDDLAVWIANAGILSGASLIQGDADLDGDVDLADFALLQQQIITGTPVPAIPPATALTVPEPTAGALLMLAACGLAARRR